MTDPRPEPFGRALHDADEGSLCYVELITPPHSALAAAATLERRREQRPPPDPPANGRLTPDRQTVARALNAARDSHLIWGWRNSDVPHITILTAPGSAACNYDIPIWDVPAFLAKRVARERCAPVHWPDRWAHLLNCMERLADQCRWWTVAP